MKLVEIRKQFESDFAFLNKIKEEVEKLAVENPDFIYNPHGIGQCYYNSGPENGPESKGCIFGQVLQNMGWTDENELKNNDCISYNLDCLAGVKGCLSATENSKYLNLLNDVQHNQDRNKSWKEAIGPLSQWDNKN